MVRGDTPFELWQDGDTFTGTYRHGGGEWIEDPKEACSIDRVLVGGHSQGGFRTCALLMYFPFAHATSKWYPLVKKWLE